MEVEVDTEIKIEVEIEVEIQKDRKQSEASSTGMCQVSRPGFKSTLCPLLCVTLASDLSCLGFSCYICKIEIMST